MGDLNLDALASVSASLVSGSGVNTLGVAEDVVSALIPGVGSAIGDVVNFISGFVKGSTPHVSDGDSHNFATKIVNEYLKVYDGMSPSGKIVFLKLYTQWWAKMYWGFDTWWGSALGVQVAHDFPDVKPHTLPDVESRSDIETTMYDVLFILCKSCDATSTTGNVVVYAVNPLTDIVAKGLQNYMTSGSGKSSVVVAPDGSLVVKSGLSKGVVIGVICVVLGIFYLVYHYAR